MRTKQAVLEILEKHKGESISGSKLSRYIGVSRTAIWKAIGELRAAGYPIEAITNRGYTLSQESDILSAQSITPHLTAPYTIEVYDSIDSTNTRLKQMAAHGASDKTAVIAKAQTAGRGRRGNSFYSPNGSGLYISILLRPQNRKAADAPIITTAAAVAVCRAVETVCGKSLSIKWINDLFYNGKKVCGILTEAATDFESGLVEHIIIGIGLNLYEPVGGFPAELETIAGYICDAPTDKSKLCAAILNEIDKITAQIGSRAFLDEYRTRSLVLGKQVTVKAAEPYTAQAIAINDNAELCVQLPNGETRVLNSGEISITPTQL